MADTPPLVSEELLRSFLSLVLAEGKRKKKHKHKPGGPRTDVGAMRQLNHDAFIVKVRDTMSHEKGDVAKAAKRLGVSKRTMYHYLDDEAKLDSVKTSSEIEAAEADKKS